MDNKCKAIYVNEMKASQELKVNTGQRQGGITKGDGEGEENSLGNNTPRGEKPKPG